MTKEGAGNASKETIVTPRLHRDGCDDVVQGLTRLAALIFQTSFAILAVGNSHGSRIRYSVGIPQGALRAKSHVIDFVLGSGTPTTVNDLRKHQLLRQDPWVISTPYVRFLAGSPLSARAGECVGAIVLMHTEPLGLVQGQQAALESLAEQIATALDISSQSQGQKVQLERCILGYEQLRNRVMLMNSVIEAIPQPVLVKDKGQQYFLGNKAGARLLGYSSFSDVSGKRDIDLLSTERAKEMATQDHQILESAKPIHREEVLSIEGRARIVRSTYMSYSDPNEAITGIIRIGDDVTDHVELQRHNRDSFHLLEMTDLLQACKSEDDIYKVLLQSEEALFDEAAGVLYIWRKEDQRLHERLSWGRAGPRKHEFELHDCVALTRMKAHIVKDADLELSCTHVLQRKSPYICVPIVASGLALGIMYLQCGEHAPEDRLMDRQRQFGRLASRKNVISTVADRIALAVTNMRLRSELENAALRDPVTGLLNRRYFEETLQLELQRCARSKQKMGLIMADIDHFKKVNDQHGHDGGDAVLRGVGGLFKRSIRDGDIACRFGGEEFVLLLVAADEAIITDRAEKLRVALRTHNHLLPDNSSISVTASFGLAFQPRHGTTLKELLTAADKACYAAKGNGRDNVVVSQTTIH